MVQRGSVSYRQTLISQDGVLWILDLWEYDPSNDSRKNIMSLHSIATIRNNSLCYLILSPWENRNFPCEILYICLWDFPIILLHYVLHNFKIKENSKCNQNFCMRIKLLKILKGRKSRIMSITHWLFDGRHPHQTSKL